MLRSMLGLALWLTAAWLAVNPPTVPGPDEIERPLHGVGIFGGDKVEPGEWPAVVGVGTSELCTGTLVAPDLVLTAAHCFDPEPAAAVQIYFGDSLSSANVVFSDEWGRHPDFCLPADCGEDLSDFAWVRLPEPVDIEPTALLTNQAEFDEVMRVGTPLWFVGFGIDEDGTSGVKRDVLASLTGFNESGREFRAGRDGKDTCNGDSGGPALVQLDSGEWRLAGVISRGGTCGEGGIYSVPAPELCWLRDASGVDLLPAGCESCDCVVLNGDAPDEGCECELSPTRGDDSRGWLGLELALVFGLGFGWRRRRARRSASKA